MSEKIRIAIVDDQTLFREGLKRMLSDIPDYTVVACGSNGFEILDKLDKNVHLLLMDVSMPEMNGFELLPKVKMRFPMLSVIALSMYDNPEYIIKLMHLGIQGYLLKDSDIDEIKAAIHKVVVRGEIYSNELMSNALQRKNERVLSSGPTFHLPTFTAKELELIQCFCMGLSAAEAGSRMNISVSTVNGHKERIMNKMNVKNIAGLVSFAHRNKLL